MDELSGLFESVAQYFGLLADPTRLRITRCICKSEKTVTQIVDEVGATQTNVSRHLALLRQAGMVTRRKDGNFVYYAIGDTALLEICRIVCLQIAGRIDESQATKKRLVRLMA
jgi:DNA-binding transcriptional ArsR family regulator